METDLRKIVLVSLLKSFLLLGNFLEDFQELNKNSFQYKKCLSEVVS